MKISLLENSFLQLDRKFSPWSRPNLPNETSSCFRYDNLPKRGIEGAVLYRRNIKKAIFFYVYFQIEFVK